MLELFRVAASMVLDRSEYDRDVSEVDKSGKNLAENLSGYFEKAKKVLTGVLSAVAIQKVASGIWNLAKETSAAGDRIDKTSQALGMSRKAFQEWDYILAQSGASIDSMGMSMKTMNEAISKNSAETAVALSRLGLSAAKLQNLSPEQQFEELVKAFQKMPASAKKSEYAMLLFGRNAQSLMPLLNSASGSVDELRNRAHELGLIMSDEDVNASVAFGDALDDLNRVWTAVKQKFGAQMLPTLTRGLVGLANSLGRITNQISKAFQTGDWSGVFETISTEIKTLLPQFIKTVVDLAVGLFQNADKIIDLGFSILTGIISGLSENMPAFVAKIPDIFNSMVEGIKALGTAAGNGIIDLINAAFGTNIPHLDKITWPTWGEVGQAFTDAWNLIKEKAADVMKLVFGTTADGAIDWPTWDEVNKWFVNWWYGEDGIAEKLKGATKWVLQMFGLPEYEAETLSQDIEGWFSGIANILRDACAWVLGLFGLPTDINKEKLAEDVGSWFYSFSQVLVDACDWVLGMFGLPKVNTEKLKDDTWNWFTGFASTLTDACSWVLGLFGFPTDVNTEVLKEDASVWFSGFAGILSSACNWVLNLFGLPEVDLTQLSKDASDWFVGTVGTLVDACSWVLGMFGLPTDVDLNTLKADVEQWFGGFSNVIVSACNWLLNLFGLPTVDVTALSSDVSDWFGGFVNTLVDACSWVLGLFGLPTNVNLETLKEDVTKWFTGFSGVLVEACNWVLNLFGLPEINTEELRKAVDTWFGGVVGTLVDACSWVLGIFGLPTDVDTAKLKEDVSNWFSGFTTVLAEACNWILNLFGLPEVNTEELSKSVGEWFSGLVGTLVDACSWVLGLFGMPTDVNLDTLREDVSKWFDGIRGTIVAACDWVLNIFGLPKISDIKSKVSDWWNGNGEGESGAKGVILSTLDAISLTFGLPKVSDIVNTINEWWQSVLSSIHLGFSAVLDSLTDNTGLFQGGEPSGQQYGEPDFMQPIRVPGWEGYAKGLNYVPQNGLYMLHRGETILNQDQGRDWRQNNGGFNAQQLYSTVASAVAAAVGDIQINMNGKAVANAVSGQVSRNLYQDALGRRYAPV